MLPSKRTNKRPGIAKRTKPQRDSLGRFAPKDDSGKTVAEQFEEQFRAQEAYWLKRLRRWLGKKLFRAAIVVYGF